MKRVLKTLTIVLLYMIGYTIHDYNMVKDCEKVGYTKTLIWKTDLACAVTLRN